MPVLYVHISRVSPYEWAAESDDAEELEDSCNLHNCFWHNVGSIMQQGSDIAPR